MSCSQCVIAALLVALVVSVQGHQIIYVDTENGTLNTSCWEGGLDHPCGSLELAATGAQRYNSTIAIVVRYGISCSTCTTALTTPQTLFCLPLPTINNGTCRCGPTASRWNESATIQKFNSVSAKFLAHLGLNHSMALVNVGIVLMVLSIVMKHCKNLLYWTAIA